MEEIIALCASLCCLSRSSEFAFFRGRADEQQHYIVSSRNSQHKIWAISRPRFPPETSKYDGNSTFRNAFHIFSTRKKVIHEISSSGFGQTRQGFAADGRFKPAFCARFPRIFHGKSLVLCMFSTSSPPFSTSTGADSHQTPRNGIRSTGGDAP